MRLIKSALLLRQNAAPVVIDEVQYAPHLFSQIKMEVDQLRIKSQINKPIYRLTGSQQVLLDENIKESLGGRASFFRLHNLSYSEISNFGLSVEEFIFKGGWPELFVHPQLNAIDYHFR